MTSISYIDDFEKWQASFSFSIPIKVRFSETDLYGHVNNTSVFIYFEEARIEYLRSLGIFNAEEKQYGFVVADLQCNYLRQMFFNETINFSVKVESIGTTSLDIHYMGMNGKNEVTVTGRGRLVMVDFSKNESTRIPREIRSIIEQEIEKQNVL